MRAIVGRNVPTAKDRLGRDSTVAPRTTIEAFYFRFRSAEVSAVAGNAPARRGSESPERGVTLGGQPKLPPAR